MTALFLTSILIVLCAVITVAAETDLDSAVHGISQPEYDALYALYYSTNGMFWDCVHYGGGVNWHFAEGANPCTEHWDGVTCGATDNGARFVAELRLRHCYLDGTLPASLGSLSFLEVLDLGENVLRGPIPDSLEQMTVLKYLYLDWNWFSGSFPLVLTRLLSLESLDLSVNFFSQTLPSSLSLLLQLKSLCLLGNEFTGPIPSDIGNLKQLEVLLLYVNRFSQALPESLAQLSRLQQLDLYANEFEGGIPTSYAQLTGLVFVDLSFNRLGGTVADIFTGMEALTSLHLASNSFVGPVPHSIGALTSLSTLHLSDNYFTGTLPAGLATMTELRLLTVEKNFLRGALADLIDANTQSQLETVLVSGNRFTGTLPEELFRIRSLRQVYCDNNCIRGALPSNVCANTQLQVLSLNGLHTSRACRNPLIYRRDNIYSVSEELQGGIPSCLYELPSLKLLDLSSNGIDGSLPAGASLGANLTTLALSHNRLTGTLPDVFQRKPWLELDLSFNRLRGHLSDGFAAQTSASTTHLRSNRFSGPVPRAFLHATNIDVLTGNMFDCNLDASGQLDRSDLPENDKGLPTFQCGSSTFLYAYTAWAVLLALLLVALFYASRAKRPHLALADTVLDLAGELKTYLDLGELSSSKGESYLPRLRRYHKIIEICRLYLAITAVATAFTLGVLLPLYSGFSASEWKYSSTRVYDMSLIYMSGQEPAAVCLVVLILFLATAYMCFVLSLRKYRCACTKFESRINYQVALEPLRMRESATLEEPIFTKQKVAVYVGCLLVDLIAVFGANIGFVWVVKEAPQQYLLPAQMALATFKTVWGSVCSWVVNYLAVKSPVESLNLKRGLLFVLVAVTLFNNIVVPCLVVLAISSTCFYDIMAPTQSVSTEAQVIDCVGRCDGENRGGYVYSSVPVEFRPPFVYSYQCSASFVTYYVASFVLMYVFNGFVMPVFRYGVYLVAPHMREGRFWHTWFYPRISNLLKPVTAASLLPKRYFDARKLVVSLVNNLGILLTFGAVFPPLAATVCVASFCRVYVLRMETKRLLRAAAALDRQDIVERLDTDCAYVGSESMMIRSIWLLLVMSCWFYSLFLFDTLGDAVGFGRAYCVLILMALLPLVAYATFRVYTGTVFVRRRDRMASSLSSQSAVVVELALRLQQAVAAAGGEVRSPMAPPEDQVGEAEEADSSA